MNFKKLLVVPFAALLLACNKQNPFNPVTKQITDDEALTRSQEILSHQEDEGFVIPKRFQLTVMERKLTDDKITYETRHFDTINNDVTAFDLDDLIFVRKEKETTNGNIVSIVNKFQFWKNGTYYLLFEENKNDINFKKYRTEEAMSREDAQAKIEEALDGEKTEITRSNDLKGFKTTITQDQEFHQKAEDMPEAKYDYRYGSNDINSLERTIDGYRITHDVKHDLGMTFDLHEETTKRRFFLDNNLLKLEYKESADDYKNNSNDYHASVHTEIIRNTNYSKNLKIALPNINDYPIKEE